MAKQSEVGRSGQRLNSLSRRALIGGIAGIITDAAFATALSHEQEASLDVATGERAIMAEWTPISNAQGGIAGYVRSAAAFAPSEARGDYVDGPFSVYSDQAESSTVIGAYFHSIGFVTQEEFTTPGFNVDELMPERGSTPTTVFEG